MTTWKELGLKEYAVINCDGEVVRLIHANNQKSAFDKKRHIYGDTHIFASLHEVTSVLRQIADFSKVDN